MSARDIILSGPVCAGKSTLAIGLAKVGWRLVTARAVIAASCPMSGPTRMELQAAGAKLEAARPGRWLVEAAAAGPRPVVLDAARTSRQISEARRLLEGCVIVHLRAEQSVRSARFAGREDAADSASSFEAVASGALEREAEALEQVADVVLATDAVDPELLINQVLHLLDVSWGSGSTGHTRFRAGA